MVKEVVMPQLATYELYPYFFLKDPARGIGFSAPAQGGATTPNSDNPRSEMRQLHEWSNSNETWNMEGVMCFSQIPISSDTSRGVVGMQIHDNEDDITVARLEKNGKLWATDGNTTHHQLMNGSYALDTYIKLRITAERGGGFHWFINDVHKASVGGVKSGCYFKWGCYTQTGPGATGQGVTFFKSLKVWKS